MELWIKIILYTLLYIIVAIPIYALPTLFGIYAIKDFRKNKTVNTFLLEIAFASGFLYLAIFQMVVDKNYFMIFPGIVLYFSLIFIGIRIKQLIKKKKEDSL